jgi:hypothetical protein
MKVLCRGAKGVEKWLGNCEKFKTLISFLTFIDIFWRVQYFFRALSYLRCLLAQRLALHFLRVEEKLEETQENCKNSRKNCGKASRNNPNPRNDLCELRNSREKLKQKNEHLEEGKILPQCFSFPHARSLSLAPL